VIQSDTCRQIRILHGRYPVRQVYYRKAYFQDLYETWFTNLTSASWALQDVTAITWYRRISEV
jgi:hypothetical protein